MKFYNLSKDGKMYSRKDGIWVERERYDQLVKRERELRKEMTLKNLKFKLLEFLDGCNITSVHKLSLSITAINFISFFDYLLKSEQNNAAVTKETQQDVSSNIEKTNMEKQ
jgi:hypothetical protein